MKSRGAETADWLKTFAKCTGTWPLSQEIHVGNPIFRHGFPVLSAATWLSIPETFATIFGFIYAFEKLVTAIALASEQARARNYQDFLIVDLPPGTGDAQLTLTQKVALSIAGLV